MIKGTNRQVIVVRSPDPQVFEEAIFVLREDFVRKGSAAQVLEQARRAAEAYLKSSAVPRPGKRGERLRGRIIGLAGALAAGLVWAALRLVGV